MDCLSAKSQLPDCEIDRLLAEAEVRLATTTSKCSPNPCQISTPRTTHPPAKPANACRQPKLQDHQSLTLRQPKPASSQTSKDKDNIGHDWYNLPRTSTDPETKKHLQLLQTRHIWDAKKHWRKSTLPLPTFSQIGILVEGQLQTTGKARGGPSLCEELLQAEQSSKQLKKRYDALQAVRQNRKGGSRGHGIRKRR